MNKFLASSAAFAVFVVGLVTYWFASQNEVEPVADNFPTSITFAKANDLISLIRLRKKPTCVEEYCAYVLSGTTLAYHSSNPKRAIASPIEVVLFVDPTDERFRHLAVLSTIADPKRNLYVQIMLIDFLGDGVIDVYIEDGFTTTPPRISRKIQPKNGFLATGSFIEHCITGDRKMCDVRLTQGRMMQPDIYESFADGFIVALREASP